MDRIRFLEHTDAAWLILRYLSSYPDAKDTVAGVQQWWMGGMQATLNTRKVQGALDELVKAGWLLSSERRGTGAVYRLNADRRQELWHILPAARHGQETGSVDSEPFDD
jgi:hypothetical protein